MTNYPIYVQNALAPLSTEIARKAWLWHHDAYPSHLGYRSDEYAQEVDKIVSVLRPLLKFAYEKHHVANQRSDADEVLSDLEAFILRRHANKRFGGNVRPQFLKGAGF